jgi:hypothetical protein
MVTNIPEYAPYLYIVSLSATLLVRAVSSLNNLPIATTIYAMCPKIGATSQETWGGENSLLGFIN